MTCPKSQGKHVMDLVLIESGDFPLHNIASDSYFCGILQLIRPLPIIIFIELHSNPVW